MSLGGWVCEVESEKLSLGKLALEKLSLEKLSPEKVYGRRDAADQNKRTGSLPRWVPAGFLGLSPLWSGCHVPVGARAVSSLGGWQRV